MGRKVKPDGSLIAYAYRSGRIEFGYVMPEGCLVIYRSKDEKRLRDCISGMARHSYPPDAYLLVPGVPEAADSVKALEAFALFYDRVRDRLQ